MITTIRRNDRKKSTYINVWKFSLVYFPIMMILRSYSWCFDIGPKQGKSEIVFEISKFVRNYIDFFSILLFLGFLRFLRFSGLLVVGQSIRSTSRG